MNKLIPSANLYQDRGFLPASDPLDHLKSGFDLWEQIAQELRSHLVAGSLRRILENLPVLDVSELQTHAQRERAMLLLSFLGHGYVWGESPPANQVPSGIAVPWYRISLLLGRHPVLSYASYALYNWRRLDPRGPIALGNLALLQNFLGGLDEAWFILVHVEIEAKAGPALAATINAQEDVSRNESSELEQHLGIIATGLEEMNKTLHRMPEKCDPYIYYNRVRPYIQGWKSNPALPKGVEYCGVEAFGGKPKKFRGETGAQSSIIPVLDAALGVAHKQDPMRPYLTEMREYMPPDHRALIQVVEGGPSIRKFVNEVRSQALVEAYNECLTALARFRSKHLEYAASYIQKQTQHDQSNPTDIGTGGTPFIPYLKKHRDETEDHLLTGTTI